ncbi:MAG: permease [Acidobacteria bacterium]|nr:MAG: permease [Acidobacteriota bacterium]
MQLLYKFTQSFYEYSVEILPFFILAVFITSLLQAYTSLSWFTKLLKNPYIAPMNTAFLAGLLPLCSCSMLPVANFINSLSRSYAPVVSFLMVAPVISPINLILTYGFFGLPMTLFRLLGTFLFALLLALLAELLFKKPKGLPFAIGGAKHRRNRWADFKKAIKDQLLGVGRYLLIGIFIASLVKTFVPPGLIAPLSGTPLSYPFISLVAIPMYVCSGEEVPVARALSEIGFTGGNSLTFMLASTGICLPTVFATFKFLPKNLVLLYLLAWFVFSTFIGFLYDRFMW